MYCAFISDFIAMSGEARSRSSKLKAAAHCVSVSRIILFYIILLYYITRSVTVFFLRRRFEVSIKKRYLQSNLIENALVAEISFVIREVAAGVRSARSLRIFSKIFYGVVHFAMMHFETEKTNSI